jgi:hypothetical protein
VKSINDAQRQCKIFLCSCEIIGKVILEIQFIIGEDNSRNKWQES